MTEWQRNIKINNGYSEKMQYVTNIMDIKTY